MKMYVAQKKNNERERLDERIENFYFLSCKTCMKTISLTVAQLSFRVLQLEIKTLRMFFLKKISLLMHVYLLLNDINSRALFRQKFNFVRNQSLH